MLYLSVAFAVLVLFACIVLSLLTTTKRKTGWRDFPVTARRPLSTFEQQMFFRLRDTLPDCIVLAQVSFSALITSRREHRNYYDRKYVDYVLCDQKLSPIAVVELDDPTHKSKVQQDAKRDAILVRAGYKVLRYTAIPPALQIRADVDALLRPAELTE